MEGTWTPEWPHETEGLPHPLPYRLDFTWTRNPSLLCWNPYVLGGFYYSSYCYLCWLIQGEGHWGYWELAGKIWRWGMERNKQDREGSSNHVRDKESKRKLDGEKLRGETCRGWGAREVLSLYWTLFFLETIYIYILTPWWFKTLMRRSWRKQVKNQVRTWVVQRWDAIDELNTLLPRLTTLLITCWPGMTTLLTQVDHLVDPGQPLCFPCPFLPCPAAQILYPPAQSWSDPQTKASGVEKVRPAK